MRNGKNQHSELRWLLGALSWPSRPRHLAVLLLLAVPLVTQVHGQEFRATITGEVQDPSGAVIQNATVTAVNVDTKVSASAKTDTRGVYSLLYLLPGIYTVTATAPRFQTEVYNRVRLDSAQQLGLNLTMKPGSVSQQVVVTEGSVELDTVSATTGGVLDQLKVENMPTVGLMVWDDVVLTQGISYSNNGGLFNLTLRNNSDSYAAAGAQTDENAFFVNGVPVSDQGSWYITPNMASVQQMQSSVMPYDAEYGRTGGAVFNANVKDGTNEYHGAVYDYYGNSALNANTWENNLTGIRKPINTRDTWGAQAGGPIRKDKTFFFGSYEQFDQHEPMDVTSTVPTPAEASGDFTGSGYTIYDPNSTTCTKTNASGGCTTYGRTEFPNDTIPAGDISPIGKAIIDLFPKPTNSAILDNYIVAAPNIYGYTQFIGRVDQNFSQNTRMYGVFLFQYNDDTTGGNGFPGLGWDGAHDTGTDYTGILDWTHIFSPNLVADLKAGYTRDATMNENGVTVSQNFTASKVGLTDPAVGTSALGIMPEIDMTDATQIFGNTDNGNMDADADFSGSITQLLGRHSLHYGGEFEDIQAAPTGVLGDPYGTFTFNSAFSQENPTQPVVGEGNEFADLLLGYPASGSVNWNEPTFVTVHYYALFVQDEYHALPNLTLNLGLRWDVELSPRDRHNRINAGFCLTCTNPLTSSVNFADAPDLSSPLLGGLQFAGVNGEPSTPFAVQWNNWQPRIGFSWQPIANTVVRGGFGLYYPWETPDVDDIGFSQTTPFTPTLDNPNPYTPDNYFNSGTPYPDGATAPTGSSLGLETDAGDGISYNDLQRQLRRTQHWSFGVQRALPAGMVLDVEYLGTQVQHVPVNIPLGIISTALQQACYADLSQCETLVKNPFFGVLPRNTPLGASPTIPDWELKRSYPLFDGVTEERVPSGSTHYNSLNVRVESRVKKFDFIFNYIYSNWMDRDAYLNAGDFIYPDYLISELDSNDRRNSLNTDAVLPIPGLKRGGPFVQYLTKDWLFDSLLLWQTGAPLGLPSGTFNFGAPGCNSYSPPGGQTRAHWFNNNPDCWTPLADWQARTTPPELGYIRAPGFTQWNPSINRIFPLPRQGMYLQFRMEALNGSNHPTWREPSTDIADKPTFSPRTSWTGLGTLPNSQGNTPRQIIASVKIVF